MESLCFTTFIQSPTIRPVRQGDTESGNSPTDSRRVTVLGGGRKCMMRNPWNLQPFLPSRCHSALVWPLGSRSGLPLNSFPFCWYHLYWSLEVCLLVLTLPSVWSPKARTRHVFREFAVYHDEQTRIIQSNKHYSLQTGKAPLSFPSDYSLCKA